MNISYASKTALSSLYGIMDYSFPSAAWSDCSSTVGLSWQDPKAAGLQWLHSFRTHGGVAITKSLLTWELIEKENLLPLELNERTFFPDRVREKQSGNKLRLETLYAWLDTNTLGMEITISNDGSLPRELTLCFNWEGKGNNNNLHPNGAHPRVAYETGRHARYRPGIQALFGEPEGSWHAIIDFQSQEDAPIKDAYELRGESYAVYCIANLANRSLPVPAGQSVTFSLVLAFAHKHADARRQYEANQPIAAELGFPHATARIERLLSKAPAIDPDFSGNSDLEKLYAQAVIGLNSLYIPGEGGLTGTKRIPWTCKHVLAGGFFWDTAFTSTGGVLINPEAAKESIEAFCEHPNSRGAMPANLTDRLIGGEGQFPIMSWGAWNIFISTHDRDWLERILPSLERHVEHWFTFFCRDYGLCYIYNSHLGNDDDARFDYCMKGLYNQPVDKIDSPDINAMLVVELRALANMHEIFSNTQKANALRDRAEALNQQIIDHFYFPEEKAFLDTEEGSRQIKSGVITPHMFLPLWAGSPLPKEAIAEIVESHMLDPNKFYGELPFPSLPFNHPEYDPEGYWRGRIWPHMVFWMCQTLWLHGYHNESTTVARNLLKMMLKTPWICENYNSATGIGWNPEVYRGWPAYNWCYATVILLMSGKHKLPPLPETSN